MTSRVFSKEKFFQALADDTRLRLLNLMADREVCVCYFVEILGQSQPKISRHLAYLRRARVVAARREGKWMHYRLVQPSTPAAVRVLHETLEWLREDRSMRAERSRLLKACCSPPSNSALRDAPTPIALSN